MVRIFHQSAKADPLRYITHNSAFYTGSSHLVCRALSFQSNWFENSELCALIIEGSTNAILQ